MIYVVNFWIIWSLYTVMRRLGVFLRTKSYRKKYVAVLTRKSVIVFDDDFYSILCLMSYETVLSARPPKKYAIYV